MRSLLVLAVAICSLSSCAKESDSVTPNITQTVFTTQIAEKNWIESWEENQQGSDIQVYRSDTYAFPVSWPRNGFRLDANGVFTGRGPSPTDGIAVYPGLWTTQDYTTFRITPSGQSTSYGLQVVSINNDVLKVRRID